MHNSNIPIKQDAYIPLNSLVATEHNFCVSVATACLVDVWHVRAKFLAVPFGQTICSGFIELRIGFLLGVCIRDFFNHNNLNIAANAKQHKSHQGLYCISWYTVLGHTSMARCLRFLLHTTCRGPVRWNHWIWNAKKQEAQGPLTLYWTWKLSPKATMKF